MVQVLVPQRMMGVDLSHATAVSLPLHRVLTHTDVPQGLGDQWVHDRVLQRTTQSALQSRATSGTSKSTGALGKQQTGSRRSSISSKMRASSKLQDANIPPTRTGTYLSITGELGDLPLSHGGHDSLPHRQLELLPENELHGFAAASHHPRVIQDFAIAQTGAIVEHNLRGKCGT